MFDRLVLAKGMALPDRIAFTWLDEDISFARLDQDVGRIAAALSQLQELTPALVALRQKQPYRHCVFILALARLGIASASLPAHDDAEFRRSVAILSPDIVLLDRATDVSGCQSMVLDEAWFEHVRSNGAVITERFAPQPERILRIALAGGTSDVKKPIALTSRYIETAIYHLLYQDALAGQHTATDFRVVPTLGVETSSGFLIVLAALAAGTRLHMLDGSQLGAVFSQKVPTVAVVSPRQIEGILAHLPPGMAPLSDLYLTVAGGSLPHKLREAIRRKLTPHIQVVYGTDECGVVTAARADDALSEGAVGHVLPWAGVEIVDYQSAPVSRGQTGIVRICGSGLVDGYHGSDAPCRQFRDGWFYPGDTGFLDAAGMLNIVGRVDDLVSFGGDKYDLAHLDERVRSYPGLKDGAMFVVPDAHGITVPWVAIVAPSDLPLDGLSAWLREEYPGLPMVTAVWIDVVPRLENGAPDRSGLAKAVLSS